MDSLISFLDSYRIFVIGSFFGLGIFMIVAYFVDIKSLLFFRKNRSDDIRKYIKDYLDEDGNIILEKLSSIWVSADRYDRYTKEEVSNLLDKAAVVAKKEIITRAEGVLSNVYKISEIQSSDDVFNKMPAEEKIASLFGDDFLDSIIGENVSTNIKSKIADVLWSYIESKKGDIKLSDFSQAEIYSIVKEIKDKIISENDGKNSPQKRKASDIANEVANEMGIEINIDKKEVTPNELVIDDTYNSNLPEDIRDRLLKLGTPKEIVNRVYIPKDKLLKINSDLEFLWADSTGELIRFYNELYLNKDIKYFVYSSFEPVKLFKDYLIYLMDNYKPDLKDSSIPAGFNKVLGSALFYNFLSMKNYKTFKKRIDKNPLLFSFMGIIVAFNALRDSKYDEIYLSFVEKLSQYINLRKEALAYRHYSLNDKTEFAASYDHLGFTRGDDIYLIPKAVDIIFGKYFLAIPYLFKNAFEMHYLPGYFPHVGRYKIKKEDGSERIDFLIKLKRDSGFYRSLINNIKNKEIKIPNYRNIISIEDKQV